VAKGRGTRTVGEKTAEKDMRCGSTSRRPVRAVLQNPRFDHIRRRAIHPIVEVVTLSGEKELEPIVARNKIPATMPWRERRRRPRARLDSIRLGSGTSCCWARCSITTSRACFEIFRRLKQQGHSLPPSPAPHPDETAGRAMGRTFCPLTVEFCPWYRAAHRIL